MKKHSRCQKAFMVAIFLILVASCFYTAWLQWNGLKIYEASYPQASFVGPFFNGLTELLGAKLAAIFSFFLAGLSLAGLSRYLRSQQNL